MEIAIIFSQLNSSWSKDTYLLCPNKLISFPPKFQPQVNNFITVSSETLSHKQVRGSEEKQFSIVLNQHWTTER
jgi:hypothetical protein